MSWLFGIAAEFGTNKELAERFSDYLCSKEILPGGIQGRIFQDSDSNFWSHNFWENIGEDAFAELKPILEKIALDFQGIRYCLAGLETDEFRYYSELLPDIKNFDFGGLIISNEIYQAAGNPPKYQKQLNGYWQEPTNLEKPKVP